MGLEVETAQGTDLLPWADITSTGLVVNTMDFSWESYESGIDFLLMLNNASQWAIGDAYKAGMMKFTKRDPTQVFTSRNVKWKTIQNYAWVCNRYSYNQRMYPPSFGHHSVVAKLRPERRTYWLERVVTEDLSVEDLEVMSARERGVEHGTPTPFDEIVGYYNQSLIAWRRLPDYPEKKIIARALNMIEQSIKAIQVRIKDGKEKEVA